MKTNRYATTPYPRWYRYVVILIGLTAFIRPWNACGPNTATAQTHPPTTYAVVAAISDYPVGSQNDLPMTVPSAQRFYQFLTDTHGMAVPSNQIRLLTNANASRDNILKQLTYLFSFAQPQDKVIFCFCGHGDANELITYNTDLTDQASIDNTALQDKELRAAFRQCAARTKLCFVDACFSGTLTKQPSSHPAPPADNRAPAVTDGTNVLVMTSSRSSETSWGDKLLNEMVFSHFLLNGLKGEADTDHNRIISAAELCRFVQHNVIQFARRRYDKPQHPVVYGHFDEDMPIVTLR